MRGQSAWYGLLPLALLCWLSPLTAEPLVNEVQPLNFGTLAIPGNDIPSSYEFPRTGLGVTTTGRFLFVEMGTAGHYLFSGFPPNTPLAITIDDTHISRDGLAIPEVLLVSDYDFNVVTTNELGDAEMALGGGLTSSGNSNIYEDGTYIGTTQLRVEYWDPDVEPEGAFSTVEQTIDLQVELRTSLVVEELQSLHFGTITAIAAVHDQARLTLFPDGSTVYSNPGDARIVSLTPPEPGILRISGAAPFYPLIIDLQDTEILLQHALYPGSTPHFILSPITTAPTGTGTTDNQGELLIRVGATLRTQLTATPQHYQSGNYEGTYTLTVSY